MDNNYTVKRIQELYDKAFDEDGNVRLCGRDVCIELITQMTVFFGSGINFGDVATGYMNVGNVKKYYEMLMNPKEGKL